MKSIDLIISSSVSLGILAVLYGLFKGQKPTLAQSQEAEEEAEESSPQIARRGSANGVNRIPVTRYIEPYIPTAVPESQTPSEIIAESKNESSTRVLPELETHISQAMRATVKLPEVTEAKRYRFAA